MYQAKHATDAGELRHCHVLRCLKTIADDLDEGNVDTWHEPLDLIFQYLELSSRHHRVQSAAPIIQDASGPAQAGHGAECDLPRSEREAALRAEMHEALLALRSDLSRIDGFKRLARRYAADQIDDSLRREKQAIASDIGKIRHGNQSTPEAATIDLPAQIDELSRQGQLDDLFREIVGYARTSTKTSSPSAFGRAVTAAIRHAWHRPVMQESSGSLNGGDH